MTAGVERDIRRGILCGLGAYLMWGFFPIYFKALAHVPAAEVLAHRILWSTVVMSFLVALTGQGREVWRVLRQGRAVGILGITTCLIAVNWGVFIDAVGKGQVLQASLGYFINPLVSVLLGRLFLGERLRPLQLGSLATAAAGVSLLTVHYGELPWIALILAFSFGFYGLLRKKAGIGAVSGLTVETMLLAPLALGYLVFLQGEGAAAFLRGSGSDDVLLPLAGLLTAMPLLLFALAARRLRLATVGFLQYITPTVQFLLAVLLYREPFSAPQLASFSLIWAGLALYTLESTREHLRWGRSPQGARS